MAERDAKKAKHGARKGPKKVSEAYLERAALHYLGRFSSTEANLRAVLERKIRRRNEDNAAPTDEQRRWVDTVVAKCVRYGYVDDTNYARSRIDALVRKGKPVRMIVQDLRYKGVPSDIAEAALNELRQDEDRDADRQAAAAYARRRRFGPFRRADRNADEKIEKEKAAMMRAGFSFSLIKETLEATEEELLDLLP
ncbi:MAG: RecX family transcriptional regulator [Alphaproteobacteria bacterium]|nr:RecX family transcriptional regulator [Alphaproteobacteria bacterium]